MWLAFSLLAFSSVQHVDGPTVRQVRVEGTEYPRYAVARLTKFTSGDPIDNVKLEAATKLIQATGLFTEVKGRMEGMPDREREMILTFVCKDAPANAKVMFQVPGLKEIDLWRWMDDHDELVHRKMPANEAAIRLYAERIQKYLVENGRPKAKVTGALNAAGDTVVFTAR